MLVPNRTAASVPSLRRIFITSTVVTAALTAASPAHADRTWINGNLNNFWSQDNNWAPFEEPNLFSGVAIFPNPVPNPNGTILLGPLEAAGELRFDVGGYTLSGGDLQLFNGNVTVNQPSGSNPTITSEIKGLNGLTKLGTGAVFFTGANSYSGPTTVSSGTLDVGGASERLPDGTDVIINSGTFLRFFFGAATETIGSLSGSGTLNFANTDDGGTDLRVGFNNSDTIFSGNITPFDGGDGSLTKIGTRNLTLTGFNTYGGGTTVSGGKLVVDTDSLPASNGVENNATLEFNQAFNGTYSGVISGSGQVVKSGGGTLTLDQTNTYSGGTRIEDGTLAISQDAHLGGSFSPLTFAGGGLSVDGLVGVALSRPIVAEQDVVINAVQAFSTLFPDGGVSGPGGIVKDGPGAVVMGVTASTYTGATIVNEGFFSVDRSETLPNTTDVTINGGFFELQNGVTESVDALNGAGSVLFAFAGNNHLILGADNGSGLYEGNIVPDFGGNGKLTKTGIGTQVLTGNNTYGEGTTVSGGRLVVDTDSLPAAGGVTNNATLEFNQMFDGTYSGVISGNGPVRKTGDGTLTLNQANTYDGVTVIEAGVLAVSDDANLGDSDTDVLFAGGTLQIGADAEFQFSGTRRFSSSGDHDAVFDSQAGSNVTINGGITGTAGVVKNGPGGLIVDTTPSTYAGSTVINQGGFGTRKTGSLPSTTDVTINSGGFWLLFEGAETVASLNGVGGLFFDGADSHLILGSNAGSGSFAGAILPGGGGNGRLTKIGAGAQSFSGIVNVTAMNIGGGEVVIDGATVGISGDLIVATNQLDARMTINSGLVAAARIRTEIVDNFTGGTVILKGGTLFTPRFESNFAFNFLGGTLIVDDFIGFLQQGGTLTPGGTSAAGRTDITSGYNMLGTLAIDLGGNSGPGVMGGHDQVTVAEDAFLNGTLDVDLVSGFTPTLGDSFVILEADEIFGWFDGFSGEVFSFESDLALAPLLVPGENPGDPDRIVLTAARPGDANLDGRVDAGDLNEVAINWQGEDRGWREGDFNGDGVVDAGDLNLVAVNWQFGVPQNQLVSFDGALAQALGNIAIPEPTTALVFTTGLIGLSSRRRR